MNILINTPPPRISVLVTSPAKNVYCLQTLAKIAVSLLEYSDEYHEEYPFSYISIKADKNQTFQLCSIFFVKAITFEFWLHPNSTDSEKLSSCITNTNSRP